MQACWHVLHATRLPDSATVRLPSVMTGLLPKGCTAFSSLGATMVCIAMHSRSSAGSYDACRAPPPGDGTSASVEQQP